ncbi:MAG: Rrf2 family transcriptional regulator [Saprospiraceae bacterium]|nr:Rrf2 family transcriptional regulator [Candidatus Opimibacter skivensis]MBL0005999.1 Rrf2 family transcriptional regulator [Candidatus Opimibacter skivensis]HQW02329.1 Rrf2 family transcriptional regulator [Saprospiraceae bacterium]HQW25945.1 Rrf2 family transcriptional regulator [Saprospiraceae bacterium]
MKISAQDEYGLRILLRIAKAHPEEGLSLSQIGELENISQAYAAKLTRSLRMAGFIQSMRGQKGGYILALPTSEIKVNHVLKAMGGVMYDEKFCGHHAGTLSLCTNSIDCSLRSLWTMLQWNMDKLLDQVSLADLLKSEVQVNTKLSVLSEQIMGLES